MSIALERRKLQKWSQEIMWSEIIPLLEARRTTSALKTALRERRGEFDIGELHLALNFCYGSAATMAVGRQIDKDRRAKSLYKLLRALHENPSIINRSWYIGKWGIEMLSVRDREDGAGDIFREKSMFTSRGVLNKVEINRDIRILQRHTSRIKGYRDKHIAHHDRNRRTTLSLNFHDLDNAVMAIRWMAVKYYQLLNRSYPETGIIHFDDGWMALLKDVPKS